MYKEKMDVMVSETNVLQNTRFEPPIGSNLASDDFDISKAPIAGDAYPQIPSNKYRTQIIKYYYASYRQYKGSKDGGQRIVLVHKIIEGPYLDTILEQYFVRYDSPGKSSKYYEAFVLLSEGQSPKKRNRMSPKAFVGAICDVWVDFTKKKFVNGEFKPASIQYSVIKEIMAVIVRNRGATC